MVAANGVKSAWVGQNGLLSTSATSAIVRERVGAHVMNYSFVGWVNPPMGERDVDVIPSLLRARNELEDDLEDQILMLREKEQLMKKLGKYLVVAYIGICCV
ncbi:hypothetical protein Tco_0363605 [Tanacetum coccineum]